METFEHLLAARDDALLRELHHPYRLRVASEQSKELLVRNFGLVVKHPTSHTTATIKTILQRLLHPQCPSTIAKGRTLAQTPDGIVSNPGTSLPGVERTLRYYAVL